MWQGTLQLRSGKSQAWNFIISAVDENRANFCKALSGKTLYSALYDTYAVTLTEKKGPAEGERLH
jgi:hypothetical protein